MAENCLPKTILSEPPDFAILVLNSEIHVKVRSARLELAVARTSIVRGPDFKSEHFGTSGTSNTPDLLFCLKSQRFNIGHVAQRRPFAEWSESFG